MSFNFPGNPPLPINSCPPPPPSPMGPPMPMAMMGPQQEENFRGQMGGPMMAGQMVHGQMVPGQMMGHMMGPQGFPMGPLLGHDNQPPQGSIMNPGLNDAPLEFNTNKNKPPMAITTNDDNDRKNGNGRKEENIDIRDFRDPRRDRDRERERSDRDRDNRRGRDRGRDRERDRDRDRRDDRDQKEVNNTASPVPKNEGSEKQAQSTLENSNSSGPSGPPGSGPGPSGPGPGPGPGPSALGPGNMGPWGGMVGPPMGYPMMGPMNPMIGPGMMDPNMMIGQYGMMGGMMGPDGTMMAPDGSVIPSDPGTIMTAAAAAAAAAVTTTASQQKEIIHCKSCTLFPPNPNLPPPTTRERPPGCKTIFVGGLPENTTEDMIREIFGRCGEMLTVRLSNKKFCHIRFVHEASVDAALYFSGYRMRIGSNTDLPNTGRLHVDFAQARDDQYEWECRQRQLQREQRHRDRVEKERMRVPSPPPVVHYTDHEASQIVEKIKSDENFTKAMQVVITWLERGDCSKRNANTFYSMIQSTNSHVRRLLSEKAQYEEELQKAKDMMKARMQGILIQFSQIERVFIAASHKKVWDHFTKPQRKNIEMWKKQATEIKQIELEENLNAGLDEEMEVSDEEEIPRKKLKKENDTFLSIKDENDSLRCQLEAYKNEVDLVRCDLKAEIEQKEKQLKLVQQTLQGMQQQLIESKKRQTEDELKVAELQARLEKEKEYKGEDNTDSDEVKYMGESSDYGDSLSCQSDRKLTYLSEKDAKLIGLISVFLHVHPFGAGVDYIWSFLHKMDSSIKPSDVEMLMARFPTVFQQELSGIGAHMERRWCFGAFKT